MSFRVLNFQALLSHLVMNDGASKCRICLGDTVEGAVFMSDIVLVKDKISFSLAKVLTNITGLHFEEEEGSVLPESACARCVHSTLTAAAFLFMVRESHRAWQRTPLIIDAVPQIQTLNADTTSAYLILSSENKPILLQDNCPSSDKHSAIHRVQDILNTNPNKNKVLPKNIIKKAQNKTDDIPVKVDYFPSSKRGPRPKIECSCPDCGVTFNHTRHLTYHLSTSHEYSCCYLCGTVTRKGTALQEHMLSAHRKQFLVCVDCPNIFESQDALSRHAVENHSASSYWCRLCGHLSKNLQNHLSHSGLMHRTRQCTTRDCSRTFTNRHCWKAHILSCPMKKIAGSVPVSVAKYKLEHTYECDYCGKIYKSKPAITAHIQHLHQKLRKWQCSICGKRYRVRADLEAHILAHDGIKPHMCDLCGARFASKKGAGNHRRLHTNDKPYPCLHELCQESFVNSCRRLEHMRRKHGWERNKIGRRGLPSACMPHPCPLPDCDSLLCSRDKLRTHLRQKHGYNNSDIGSLVDASIRTIQTEHTLLLC